MALIISIFNLRQKGFRLMRAVSIYRKDSFLLSSTSKVFRNWCVSYYSYMSGCMGVSSTGTDFSWLRLLSTSILLIASWWVSRPCSLCITKCRLFIWMNRIFLVSWSEIWLLMMEIPIFGSRISNSIYFIGWPLIEERSNINLEISLSASN